jgi:hypothetical protein
MGDMTFRKLRLGNVPELDEADAGGTLEAGDIAKFNASSALIKMAANETAADLVLVLNDATSGQTVNYIVLREGVIIEGEAVGSAPNVGDLVGVDLDGGVCKFGGTGTEFFQITSIDGTLFQAERVA